MDSRTRVSVPSVVRLAAVGGMLAGQLAGAAGAEVRSVSPATWKGSTPKPVAHARMWRSLSPEERAVLGGDPVEAAIHAAQRRGALERWRRPGAAYYRAGDPHDLLDASGIALHALGRPR